MALIQCQFFSEVLGLSTQMTVILPQKAAGEIGVDSVRREGKYPVLYLLHGYSDDDTIWLRRTSIERYVSELGMAVVMPNVHQSFYSDMEYGNPYWTFLSEELPKLASSFFPLSDKREDRFVAGLSMGGYGAFKWALRCPDQFAAAASLSGVLDLAAHIQTRPFTLKSLQLVFGDRDITGSEEDTLWLLEKAAASNGPKPLLYQCCGTEDFLYEGNVKFKELADRIGYEVTTEFDPGDHNWEYWDAHIQKVLKWLPLKERASL
ncbi:esterase [Paenibacillus yonginensis]|uniref:Esterase n=1 Tax=Paenibacillus yonginensis TaxID=1462996 RepID=A0A1B1N3W7_9BACL|nr:alpha/beta hydrolase family protein [Paenibacillus yonginensis]ANS76138.1 esterase [Paenibacillus yonginensis]